MTTSNVLVAEWHAKQTDETNHVRDLLREHFEQADAYRYNSAAIRVRVVDDKFKGVEWEDRDDLVEPILSQLDESTQADILNLVLLYPDEEKTSVRSQMANLEFDHPSRSML